MRVGVDVGGTKIEAIALGDGGEEIFRERVDTPRNDYRGTVNAIGGLVKRIEARTGRRGTVGVGIPGTISPASGLVKNANSTWLIGRPFDKDLSHALDRPVRLSNDANCFAISEAIDGAAAGAYCVFGVIVGTGCGGGVVVRGRELVGPNAVGGEWGHNELPRMTAEERPGPPCYCGLNGCIETFISGPGLARDHKAASGEELTAEEVVARAEAGDPVAQASLERYEDRMARALSSVINVLDPDVIVLGGGMSNIRRLYRNVPRIWDRYVFSDRVDTPLVPAVHGDSSGVRGAAWLWTEEEMDEDG
ncbi:MAG: fructokinase [Alphaproteobacteria bacterium]